MSYQDNAPHLPDLIFPSCSHQEARGASSNYADCEGCGGLFLRDSSQSTFCHRPECVAKRQQSQRKRERRGIIECRIPAKELLSVAAENVQEFITTRLVECGVPITGAVAVSGVEWGKLEQRTNEETGELIYRWFSRGGKKF